ncbi:MAG: zinc-ribbon and DUF3426 domain-containing protein [Betaproteobacteria bacterium]
MLLTTCPNCSAQFKVQPEQLNVRQGRVMCGRCRNVFNAFQSLMRVSDEDASVAAPPAAFTPIVLHVDEVAEEASPELTDAIFLREEPLPLSNDFTQTDFASDLRDPVDSPSPLAPQLPPLRPLPPLSPVPPPFPPSGILDLDDIDDEPALANVAQPIGDARMHAQSAPATNGSLLGGSADADAMGSDNPLLIPSPTYRQPQKTSRGSLWITGALLLLLSLGAQLAYAYRSTITQAWPQLRPAYTSACEWVGCTLSWGRDDNAIRIEASDLIELPGKAGRILLTATLVNRSTVRQDLPALELKLTDNANQVMLSRILQPPEYLGRTPAKDESLAPNAEMYVNLSFDVTQKAPASGYGVRAFYN